MFSDLAFRLVPRSTDVNWSYSKCAPFSLTGFNPFERAYYYGQGSRFAAWLTDPYGSARNFNENDLLVREVLFMTHDYLHAWTYSIIDRLFPGLRLLHGAITRDTFDDYVFCHLLSETVATIGVDYWLLCERGVNEFCPIGSNMGPLTVSYREARLPEYRRFCPRLEVQAPAFFQTLATFYCTGEFPGFDADDLRRSPQLLSWLRHELSYGATQRTLTRRWLAYLSDEPIARDDWSAPLDTDAPVRRQLVEEVGRLLWAMVKDGRTGLEIERPASPPARGARPGKPPDFRFVNVARVPEAEWTRALQPTSPENFKFFLYQYLGQIPLEAFPERLLKHVSLLLMHCDLSLTLDLTRDLPRREPLDDEPRDLMIAN
ncbi:MAG TPA: hypothetical protein VFK02_27930 [Kofleriaceae bacterium]|nr:hypothetical protein [Kofleriaceae bacterium]